MNTGRTHFKKGQSPWNKGEKVSKNCLNCGEIFSVHPFRKEISKYCSRICRIKMRQCVFCGIQYRGRAGQKFCSFTCHVKEKKGKIPKNIYTIAGWNYIEDRSKLKRFDETNLRSSAYYDWSMQVKKRDKSKCRINNSDCDGRVEAHHILGWAEYVELRYEINNGITLCHAHHSRKRAEEKRLVPEFRELVSVSKV